MKLNDEFFNTCVLCAAVVIVVVVHFAPKHTCATYANADYLSVA